jgi:predicted DNA binding CopG/RHH family protein
MADKQIVRPRFNSEKEEAEWWDNNPDYILQEFKRAKEEGRLGHGTVARRMAEIKEAAKSTTIRLDPTDLSLAKAQAEKKGLKYQTYVKMLLHEALQREDAVATK